LGEIQVIFVLKFIVIDALAVRWCETKFALVVLLEFVRFLELDSGVALTDFDPGQLAEEVGAQVVEVAGARLALVHHDEAVTLEYHGELPRVGVFVVDSDFLEVEPFELLSVQS